MTEVGVNLQNQTVNILMVDDRHENLLALESVLVSSHYHLVRAESGAEALRMVLQMEFAVILMDVQMPDMNGFETAKLIKAREKSKETAILFITALSQSQEHVMEGYALGAIDYIFKPFDPDILKSKVHNLVQMYLHRAEIQYQREQLRTQQQELEEAHSQLRKSEALARVIAESSSDSMLTLDHNGQILKVNPAVKTMFGYDEQDVIGEQLSLLLPELSHRVLSDLSQTRAMESEAMRKDGTVFTVDYQINVGRIEDGFIWVCSIRDISERKQHYDKLESLVQERTQALQASHIKLQNKIKENDHMYTLIKESEEKYRQLVEGSPETILVRKIKEDTWSFINDTGLKMFGAESKNQILGKSLYQFIPEHLHQQVRDLLKAVDQGNELQYHTFQLKRLDGELIDVQIKVIPFIYRGEKSVHIVIRDVTELKKSREFIEQSDKLTMVGELAAGIAHEIRNPLTSLRGFVQLLDNGQGTNKGYTRIMLSEVDRINAIVSELLLLSKPVKADFESVDLKELIYNVVTLIEAHANLYGVEIKMVDHTQEAVISHCEDNKMKQVFINILKNAIEAMPKGGVVTISLDQDDDFNAISIEDEGCGISEEQLSRIGKPFYTTKDNGTGLGIMICQSIIENHKGHMHITSELGKGTTVHLLLPNCMLVPT